MWLSQSGLGAMLHWGTFSKSFVCVRERQRKLMQTSAIKTGYTAAYDAMKLFVETHESLKPWLNGGMLTAVVCQMPQAEVFHASWANRGDVGVTQRAGWVRRHGYVELGQGVAFWLFLPFFRVFQSHFGVLPIPGKMGIQIPDTIISAWLKHSQSVF